ncbi:hypothetical protein D3C86_1582210 [compost metagenome]
MEAAFGGIAIASAALGAVVGFALAVLSGDLGVVGELKSKNRWLNALLVVVAVLPAFGVLVLLAHIWNG